MADDADVIVVGAGLAGLVAHGDLTSTNSVCSGTAGRELLENGKLVEPDGAVGGEAADDVVSVVVGPSGQCWCASCGRAAGRRASRGSASVAT